LKSGEFKQREKVETGIPRECRGCERKDKIMMLKEKEMDVKGSGDDHAKKVNSILL
jgi:hypothetical protein